MPCITFSEFRTDNERSDLQSRRLVGNPAHGSEQILELY